MQETNEFNLLVTTERSIINLADGVPSFIIFNHLDLSKHMMFSLPEGESTV